MKKNLVKKIALKVYMINLLRFLGIAILMFLIIYSPLKILSKGEGNSIFLFSFMIAAFPFSFVTFLLTIMSFRIWWIASRPLTWIKFDHQVHIKIDDFNSLISGIRLEMKKYQFVEDKSGHQIKWVGCSGISLKSSGEVIILSLSSDNDKKNVSLGISSYLILPHAMSDNQKNVLNIQSILASIKNTAC